MPANLTPQYYEAEKAYKQAKTVEEKISALQEMLAVIPKHKGTEKLQGQLKKKLSKLREEGEKKSKSTSTYNPYRIDKEGAGQIILIGLPNVGKSSVLGALSNARVNIAEFPFSTGIPLAGMVPYEDVKIQVIDTPPLVVEDVPGEMVGAVQRAEAVVIVINAGSGEALDQLSSTVDFLEEKRLVREEIPEGVKAFRREDLLVIANKIDLPGAQENLGIIDELYPDLRILPISVKTGKGLEEVPRVFFEMLDVIRIYSKVPGKDPDMEAPFVLRRGGTVLEFAQEVHKDLADGLEKARIWGSAKFDGQPVPRDHVLADKDIVELHT